jgi:repressor LexA
VKPPLTERQNAAFEFIRAYMRTNRKPPTITEIGQALRLRSTNSVSKLLNVLVRKGYLDRQARVARGIRIADPDQDPLALSEVGPQLILVSRTASDRPDDLRTLPAAFVSVDPYLLRSAGDPEACLLARAGDDGMAGEGIRKGDLLVIEEVPWRTLHIGELAAFLLRDIVAARRLAVLDGRFTLRPAERSYAEESYAIDDPACHPVGRIVALMRRL